jgi:hypothetical protein
MRSCCWKQPRALHLKMLRYRYGFKSGILGLLLRSITADVLGCKKGRKCLEANLLPTSAPLS